MKDDLSLMESMAIIADIAEASADMDETNNQVELLAIMAERVNKLIALVENKHGVAALLSIINQYSRYMGNGDPRQGAIELRKVASRI